MCSSRKGIQGPRYCLLSVTETGVQGKADGACLKHCGQYSWWSHSNTCSDMEHFNTIDTSRCFLSWPWRSFSLHPWATWMLWELQSSANNEIIQDFFWLLYLPDMPGWVCAPVWEATSAQVCMRVTGLKWVAQALADALCCETSFTTVEIVSCGSSNIILRPLFLFLWGDHR